MRAVSVAFSPGRPSRLKKEPGILPVAYMRSSTSTVKGRKSTSRTAPPPALASTILSPPRPQRVALADDDCSGGLLGHPAGLERDLASRDLQGNPRNPITAHIHYLPVRPFTWRSVSHSLSELHELSGSWRRGRPPCSADRP